MTGHFRFAFGYEPKLGAINGAPKDPVGHLFRNAGDHAVDRKIIRQGISGLSIAVARY